MEEEVGKAVDCCLTAIKWRLKPSSKRRLLIDVLALCTRMRPVVMVDYGGKLPELQERLCALVKLLHNESPIFQPLRVMAIEDMIYLIHVPELAKHVSSSLESKSEPLFVDLEQDPPKIVTRSSEHTSVVLQLFSIMRLFSLDFTVDDMKSILEAQHIPNQPRHATNVDKFESAILYHHENYTRVLSLRPNLLRLLSVDLNKYKRNGLPCSNSLHAVEMPLGGVLEFIVVAYKWLLGYPVVYLFGKNTIPDAVHNLSTKSLHFFKIFVCRNSTSNKEPCYEELMSFSVPYDLSMRGSSESWATEFLSNIRKKLEECKPAWTSLHMEVNECNPLAVVL